MLILNFIYEFFDNQSGYIVKLRITSVSDKGCLRENNEDMVLVGNHLYRDDRSQCVIELNDVGGEFIVAVADGMGGANAGEDASQLVLEELRDRLNRLPTGLSIVALSEHIKDICQTIHQDLIEEGMNDRAKLGMGSTLVALYYYDGTFLVINVGDSRIYRIRGGVIRQLSQDHTLRELSGNSEIPSNILVNSFGGGNSFYVDIETAGGKVLDGDVFLLCSDGLSDMLSDEEIEGIVGREGYEDALLQIAKDKGGRDNISYVLVDVS